MISLNVACVTQLLSLGKCNEYWPAVVDCRASKWGPAISTLLLQLVSIPKVVTAVGAIVEDEEE